MRRSLSLVSILAGTLFGAVAGNAIAQRLTQLDPPTTAYLVELRPTDGGAGFSLTAYAHAESAEGISLDKSVSCDSSELTAGQRTAAGTMRTAAVQCWRAKALDGGFSGDGG